MRLALRSALAVGILSLGMVTGTVVMQAVAAPAGAQNVPTGCNLTVPLVCLEAMVTPQNSVASVDTELESPLNQGDTVAANLITSSGLDQWSGRFTMLAGGPGLAMFNVNQQNVAYVCADWYDYTINPNGYELGGTCVGTNFG